MSSDKCGDAVTLSHRAAEAIKLMSGIALLALAGVYVAGQVAACTIWEAIDKRTVDMVGWASKISQSLSHRWTGLVNHPADGFVVNLVLWLGVLMPAYFFYELYMAVTVGFSWPRILIYNLIRIGPMYANFMYVYVMCHKEAHCNGHLFARKYSNPVLSYIFNHWIGLFHGVLPGVFTYSHVNNHHKYDNDHRDVYSTAFRPRDRFTSWLRYLPEWFAYAANVSTIISFVGERRYKLAFKTTLSTVAYLAFVAVFWRIHPLFTLMTLVYAFVEGNILLSVVNYVWHAFIDPDDPANDFVNSTTIVDGENFTLGEEYHVVHHQYAGAHWTRHRELYFKHLASYESCVPTTFHRKNLFEVFGLIVAQDYGALADAFYKPMWPKGMTREEMMHLLKRRLRAHGPDLARRVGRTHKAKAACAE